MTNEDFMLPFFTTGEIRVYQSSANFLFFAVYCTLPFANYLLIFFASSSVWLHTWFENSCVDLLQNLLLPAFSTLPSASPTSIFPKITSFFPPSHWVLKIIHLESTMHRRIHAARQRLLASLWITKHSLCLFGIGWKNVHLKYDVLNMLIHSNSNFSKSLYVILKHCVLTFSG